MFNRIQVALDGSRFAEQSLPVAESLAKAFEATLDLVSVHEPVVGVEMEGWDQSAASWTEEYICRVSKEVADRSGLHVESKMLFGTPVRALLDHAGYTGADLIIAATHGRGVLSRAWLGSVADGLLRHSERPIMLLHPEEPNGDGEVESMDPRGWKRILVPLDGTEFSCGIIETALPLARKFGAALELVRVVPFPMEVASPYLPTTVQMNQQVLSAAKEAAASWLEEKVAFVESRGVEAHAVVKVASQPASAICARAEEADVDLIVMATHGRKGLSRAFLGSTADKVIRSTSIPLLTHRPPVFD